MATGNVFNNPSSKTFTVVAASVLGIIGICLLVLTEVDRVIFILINGLGSSNQEFWSLITYIGDGRFIACFLIIVFWKNPNALLISIFSALSVHFSVQYLKRLFAVPRPEHSTVAEVANFVGPALNADDFAFPSGHSAATAMAVFLVLQTLRKESIKFALLGIGLFVALSRVVVGAHWPADVFGGVCLGGMIVYGLSYLKLPQSKISATLVYFICVALLIKVIAEANDYAHIALLGVLDVVLAATGIILCLAGMSLTYGYDLRHFRWNKD